MFINDVTVNMDGMEITLFVIFKVLLEKNSNF